MCIHAANQCLVRSCPPNLRLNSTIRRVLGNQIEDGLRHNNTEIRLASFRSLEIVIPSLYSAQTNCDSIDANKVSLQLIEVGYWKKNLRYAVKIEDKGFILQLLATAIRLADRLLLEDPLLFKDFVVDFLIKSFFLDHLGYPGTVSAKENFGLLLVEKIFALVKESDELFQKPSDIQRNALQSVKLTLLSDDVLNALHNLCHSSWESTRVIGFEFLCKLLVMAKQSNIPLPLNWGTYSSIAVLKLRAVHLTSSPRPKEADTGARILAILSLINGDLVHELVDLLNERLTVMQSSLHALVSLFGPLKSSSSVTESKSNAPVGSDLSVSPNNLHSLPLAHGFMLAMRLSIECNKPNNSTLDFHRVAALCNQAIEMSLVVVADMIDNSIDEGMSTDENTCKMTLSTSVSSSSQNDFIPLNINTGALGANASFASIKFSSAEDSDRRAFTQRIIVSYTTIFMKIMMSTLTFFRIFMQIGTWLLTKEACATLASVIKHYPGGAPSSVVESAGYLLIAILMSLKHQGGAHAAHKALQEIASVCYTYTTNIHSGTQEITSDFLHVNNVEAPPFEHSCVGNYPIKWIGIILGEISMTETVRDSTLRRSTGFALGVLSLLRGAPRQFISFTMEKLLMLSDEKNDDNRSRVHALNILKVVILDASLKTGIRRFIDDCLTSAFVGYSSLCWAVKNSATMMLSAVMLHAVDSHRNTDASIEQVSAFAINLVFMD